MKVYTKNSDRILCDELKEKLDKIRKKRAFEPKFYIESKTKLLNQYMEKFGLKACIVAVSGGIDSAITLAIIAKAANLTDSGIKKIVPLLLPCFDNTGVVNQKDATKRGEELCKALNLDPIIINMNPIVKAVQSNVDSQLGYEGEAWAVGQLVPYSRTPVLYYTTSLLNQEGYPAVICGTTNFDEGGYLGYVGKASDGMVDLQIISDLHKSEVYKVAKLLNIPDTILNVTPAGDMYDSRADEEVFGAPYDFVELYLNYLNYTEQEKELFIESLSIRVLEQFRFYQSNLEELHKYNAHKYLSKSPAVHLDLYDSGVKGGWDSYRETLKEIFE